MRQYTTPTHTLRVAGVNLSSGCKVLVTYRQTRAQGAKADALLTVDGSALKVTRDGADSLVAVTLTQEQTTLFERGFCDVQVNWVTVGGKRAATVPHRLDVGENLLREVKTYG